MKNRKKQYLRSLKLAKKLAAVAVVATALSQSAFSLTSAVSVHAQESAATSSNANRDVKRTPIPFKTIYEEDPTLEAGQKRVRVKGVEGFKEVITSTTPDVSAIAGKGNGVLNFTTKAPVSTNSENQIEPLTTVHVYDYSSSYAGKVKDSLRLSKKIIEANKNENSRHILQLYPDNYSQTSYHA